MIYIWQLPQHLIGLALIFFSKAKYKENIGTSKIFIHNYQWGISLGQYIIVSKNSSNQVHKHEYGHSIQSKYFGWFYLLVIGLPSIIQNIISRITYKLGYKKYSSNYYNRYPENWADKLGKVVR